MARGRAPLRPVGLASPARALPQRHASPATRIAATALVVLIAVVVPPVLVVNGFRVLATDTFVRWELGRDGFPPDLYGFTAEQREALALIGLESIEPGSKGIVLLERATLPNGSPAFDRRELSHMQDVRTLFGVALRGQLVVMLLVAVLALGLARTRLRVVVPRGLLGGALLTLMIAVLAVPLILLGFEGFFTRFHEAFFQGDSWRFSTADTLIRLYPDLFWRDVSRLVAAITVAQAAVLAPLAWWWARRAARSTA